MEKMKLWGKAWLGLAVIEAAVLLMAAGVRGQGMAMVALPEEYKVLFLAGFQISGETKMTIDPEKHTVQNFSFSGTKRKKEQGVERIVAEYGVTFNIYNPASEAGKGMEQTLFSPASRKTMLEQFVQQNKKKKYPGSPKAGEGNSRSITEPNEPTVVDIKDGKAVIHEYLTNDPEHDKTIKTAECDFSIIGAFWRADGHFSNVEGGASDVQALLGEFTGALGQASGKFKDHF